MTVRLATKLLGVRGVAKKGGHLYARVGLCGDLERRVLESGNIIGEFSDITR
jgi:hypothetical protein